MLLQSPKSQVLLLYYDESISITKTFVRTKIGVNAMPIISHSPSNRKAWSVNSRVTNFVVTGSACD